MQRISEIAFADRCAVSGIDAHLKEGASLVIFALLDADGIRLPRQGADQKEEEFVRAGVGHRTVEPLLLGGGFEGAGALDQSLDGIGGMLNSLLKREVI